MERTEQISKSCKLIQREINKLKKLSCNIDLAGHSLQCFDNTIEPLKLDRLVNIGETHDYSSQVVFDFRY